MSELTVDIKNLFVQYRTFEGQIKVLNGVNLSVKRGKRSALSEKPAVEKQQQ